MRLAIVFPAHNEESRIGPTLDAYSTVCVDPETRFFVALDDCTDRTEHVVRAHALSDPRVELRRFPKLGKGGVIMEMFRSIDTDLLAFVDADCATPPSELLRLADSVATGDVDGAIASRWHPAAVVPQQRRRALSRRIASVGFAHGVRRVFGLPYRDTQCGAKVFRRDAMDLLLPLLSSRDFLFDVDLLVTARALGLRLREVPTIWLDQQDSRLQAGRDGRRMAVSMLQLWLHHRVMPVRHPVAAYPDEPAEYPVAAPENELVTHVH
ncbi:MAG TPA: glycosyltransferase [Mycobacteriales bacterium]|jgi:glycosyltransferase involved in cell wall biosynthesis|nr:glycosyltransferase [Mycobacteriales bacterium]